MGLLVQEPVEQKRVLPGIGVPESCGAPVLAGHSVEARTRCASMPDCVSGTVTKTGLARAKVGSSL